VDVLDCSPDRSLIENVWPVIKAESDKDDHGLLSRCLISGEIRPKFNLQNLNN